jgi:hypothetical protein
MPTKKLIGLSLLALTTNALKIASYEEAKTLTRTFTGELLKANE